MKEKYKVLIVEDEKAVRKFLLAGISSDIYTIVEAENGKEGMNLAAQYLPDIIILDLGLPDIDGMDFIKNIRDWYKGPIVVLSARWKENDKVAALDSGADDYITKPFGINELLARIRVALRKAEKDLKSNESESSFESGLLKVDFSSREVFVENKKIHLTPIEYKLLTVMIKYSGRVVTHKQLLNEVWGGEKGEEFYQYVRVYMAHLRRKIEPNPAHPKILITETGVGYRMISE